MKRYKCHKIVEAGEIASLGFGLVVLSDGERVSISASDEDRITKMMTADRVHGLGYLVRYEDGYLSWSPKAVLEAGYTLESSAHWHQGMATNPAPQTTYYTHSQPKSWK